MDALLNGRLREVCDLWNSAERATKEAELISRHIVTSAINELRYAGRWLVLLIAAAHEGRERIDAQTSLDDAISYAKIACLQAKHDAVDAAVLFLHIKVEDAVEQYGRTAIENFVPELPQFLQSIDEVDILIADSREHRERRHDIYEGVVANHLSTLRLVFQKIRDTRPFIEKAIKSEHRRMEEERRNHDAMIAEVEKLRAQVTGLNGQLVTLEKKGSDAERRSRWLTIGTTIVGIVAGASLSHFFSESTQAGSGASPKSNLLDTTGGPRR